MSPSVTKPRILNVTGNTSVGPIQLQAAIDVMRLYGLIKEHFEQELLLDPSQLSDTQLQRVLGTRAETIPAFSDYSFDSDVRLVELAILVGILETLRRIGGLSKDHVVLPAWQVPGQKEALKNFSQKESWDGFILAMPRKGTEGDTISIPMELKSLMANPNEEVAADPNEQLKSRLAQFRPHFQQPGSMNCVLLLPYTNAAKLSVDLKSAADDLRATVTSQAASFVCLLSFPENEAGKTSMSILFALISKDPAFMSATNTEKWICQINFGKS